MEKTKKTNVHMTYTLALLINKTYTGSNLTKYVMMCELLITVPLKVIKAC